MTKIKISKALKLKNRLSEKISKFGTDIIMFNSTPKADTTREVVVDDLMKERDLAVDQLVELKSKITEANVNGGVQAVIYRLAELKGKVSFISGINTFRGLKVPEFYNTPPIEYDSMVTKPEIDKMIVNLEKEIDLIQEKLDTFNYTNEIEVSFDID
jgi:hypothetical protein